MSHQIVSQPDGKYLIFSSITDDILLRDCTEEDIIGYYLKIEEEKIKSGVRKIIGLLEEGGKPYYQFTRTYDDVLELASKGSSLIHDNVGMPPKGY